MSSDKTWISIIESHSVFSGVPESEKTKIIKTLSQSYTQLTIAENKNEVESIVHALFELNYIPSPLIIIFLQEFTLNCSNDTIKSKLIELYMELDGITPMRPFLEKLLLSSLDNENNIVHPKTIISITTNIHIPFLIDQTANQKNILSYFLDKFLKEILNKNFKDRTEVIVRSIQTLELLYPGTEASPFLLECIQENNDAICLNALKLIMTMLRNNQISNEHKEMISNELKKQMKNKLNDENSEQNNEIWKIQKLKTDILAHIEDDLCISFVEEIL